MKIDIIANTNEVGNSTENLEELHDNLVTFAGKCAGVCYSKGDYFSSGLEDIEKAKKRAYGCCKSGHHSVFEHCTITFAISEIPKILAMVLNSLEVYNTSEKSGRYSTFEGETELERQMYNKWQEKFEKIILEKCDYVTEKEAKKLANENARYMLSVFTPTYMIYTVTYRQLAYLIKWLKKFSKKMENSTYNYIVKLAKLCGELAELFNKTEGIGFIDCEIEDINEREIEFIRDDFLSLHMPKIISDVYQVDYDASFVAIAQLERQRSIHYEVGPGTQNPWYIPKIIRGTELENEWIYDLEALTPIVPNATLLHVKEQGRTVKFLDKCRTRLCNRAQLETMDITANTLIDMYKSKDQLSDSVYKALLRTVALGKINTNNDGTCEKKSNIDKDVIVPKCKMYDSNSKLCKCKECCNRPKDNLLDRII